MTKDLLVLGRRDYHGGLVLSSPIVQKRRVREGPNSPKNELHYSPEGKAKQGGNELRLLKEVRIERETDCTGTVTEYPFP